MPVVCYKPFTITVNPQITAYWTLDESAVGAQKVDSVGGNNLAVTSGPGAEGLPALISNGIPWSNFENDGDHYQTINAFNYTAGQSFSYWGWFNITGSDVAGLFGPYLSFYCFAGQQWMIELANTNNAGNVHIMATSGGNNIDFNVSVGVWHLFHIYHDGTTSRDLYSIDGGAPGTLPNPSSPITSTGIMLMGGDNLGPSTLVVFDEIGLMIGSHLNPSQVLYLYNAGFGRTWPITLPP